MSMDPVTMVARCYERTGDDVVMRRPDEPDRPFKAVVSISDDAVLGGGIVAASNAIQFPTAAGTLKEGDEIEHAGARYQVLEDSRRIHDGHESVAPLAALGA